MASILRQLNGLPYKKGKATAYPSNTATINILIVICLIPEHFRILNPLLTISNIVWYID